MIALTGATGAVGGRVAAQLADLPLRLVVRDPARAPQLPGAEVAVATYDEPDTLARAFDDVDALLLVSAAENAERRRQHRTAIAAAARAGVPHVVYTSFAAAAPDATFTLGRDHFDAETALAEAGLPTTLLRDNLYSDLLPFFAGEDGAIRGPAGDGRLAAVARADVADVAAAVLRDPAAHADATYLLTGPEALSLDEVAARAGAVLGRELRFVDETVEEAYAQRAAAYPDAETWQLDAWVSTYTAIADGSMAAVSDDVERVTGHRARTIEEALATT